MSSAKMPEKGSKSPANTPDQQLSVLGGLPPVKTEAQIDAENMPKKAPGSVKSSN